MGKRGPAPLPAEVHLRRGTHRPERHGDGTPFALAGKPLEAPEAPARLNDRERTVWCELVPIFYAAGVLDGADVYALEAMVIAIARATAADAALRARELELEDPAGALYVRGDRGYVQHPLVKISRDSWAEARAWFAKFGATPSDRVGLAVGGLQGMSLAAQLEAALGAADAMPAPQLGLELEIVAELCDHPHRDGRACDREPGHAGRHRYA
jgi:P27 family predicted phage terminase small subunit